MIEAQKKEGGGFLFSDREKTKNLVKAMRRTRAYIDSDNIHLPYLEDFDMVISWVEDLFETARGNVEYYRNSDLGTRVCARCKHYKWDDQALRVFGYCTVDDELVPVDSMDRCSRWELFE